jgi:hypothetical protein
MKVPVISEITKYSRLAWDLRAFLRHKITLEESKNVITARLQNREKNFLSLVGKGIYGNPKSPYLKLLKLAGCEFGDLEQSVNKDGLEATLNRLFSEGVYISWEEFKGKRDIVRGGTTFEVYERDFDNTYLPSYYYVRSSGSRSAGTRTMLDLKHRADLSYYFPPSLAVSDALGSPFGMWLPLLPSSAGISGLLHNWQAGNPALKWFSQVNEKEVQASLRDRLAMRYIIYGGRLWGAQLPYPENVGLNQAVKVAQWMAETKKKYGSCSLSCFTSSTVKVCQAAVENGLDISNCHFFIGGEPLTEAKRKQIESAGATVCPRYWITEISLVGCGCSGASAADDVHLFTDTIALIQRQRKVFHYDINVNSFLFTSLLKSSPKIIINVESDDYGVVENVKCGCLFEQMGLTTHLHDIRSYAKLTGSGMTILGSDFVHILEQVLPDKYGGAPTDYQLIEEEDERGQTCLSLIISPAVGAVDNKDAINTVLDELRRNAYGGKLAAGFWSQVNTLRVKRIQPLSSSGKITTMHLMKKKEGHTKNPGGAK